MKSPLFAAILFILSPALAPMGSSGKDASPFFKASNRFPICINLGEKISGSLVIERAHDFEVMDIDDGGMSGNVYIGDFPDFPRMNFNKKEYEPLGSVAFLGQSASDGVEKMLFRFGLGKEPSVYVLLSFRDNYKLPGFFDSASRDSVVRLCEIDRKN